MTRAQNMPFLGIPSALGWHLRISATTGRKVKGGAVWGLKWLSRRIDIFSAGFRHVARR